MKQDLPIRQTFEYILSQQVVSLRGTGASKKGLSIRANGQVALGDGLTERSFPDALTNRFGADRI